MKRLIWLAVFCLCLMGAASAEIADCTDSARSFSQGMALLTQMLPQQAENGGLVPRAWSPQLVLCRTDGSDLTLPEGMYAVEGPGSRYAVLCTSDAEAARLAQQLKETDGVLWAEPDTDVYAMAAFSPEDYELAPYSTGVRRMNVGPFQALARAFGSGSVTVAIIDSGCQEHTLLRGRILRGGHDYVDNDDDATNDGAGHGTHVAGIVADCTNGTRTMILPIRVLNAEGKGKMSNVACAVLEAKEAGVDIINLSLGSSVMSDAMDDAILTAVNAGCIVVTASGNSSVNTANVCPAHMTLSGMIVVGSAEISGGANVRAYYSNYGVSVDLYSYGSSVQSTWLDQQMMTRSGTSMAAAQITGICALMRHLWPGISPSAAEKRLVAVSSGAVPVPDLAGLIPETMGANLREVQLDPDETLRLWTQAAPLTACAPIAWTVEDESVAMVTADGVLTPLAPGETAVSAACRGLEPLTFRLTVTSAADGSSVTLPALSRLEEEALCGVSLRHLALPAITFLGSRSLADCPDLRTVRIPGVLADISPDALQNSPYAVLLCPYQSAAASCAAANGQQYLLDPITEE